MSLRATSVKTPLNGPGQLFPLQRNLCIATFALAVYLDVAADLIQLDQTFVMLQSVHSDSIAQHGQCSCAWCAQRIAVAP